MSDIVGVKQKIKEMILQDTEITKILLGTKENNYKNVKDLVKNNVFNYIRNDNCCNKSGFHICYEADYMKYHGDMVIYAFVIIQPIGDCNNNDENYNSVTDILSELILKDARSTFDVMDFSNVSEQTNNSDIRRRVTIIVLAE